MVSKVKIHEKNNTTETKKKSITYDLTLPPSFKSPNCLESPACGMKSLLKGRKSTKLNHLFCTKLTAPRSRKIFTTFATIEVDKLA
jgi:hypothetical protein